MDSLFISNRKFWNFMEDAGIDPATSCMLNEHFITWANQPVRKLSGISGRIISIVLLLSTLSDISKLDKGI